MLRKSHVSFCCGNCFIDLISIIHRIISENIAFNCFLSPQATPLLNDNVLGMTQKKQFSINNLLTPVNFKGIIHVLFTFENVKQCFNPKKGNPKNNPPQTNIPCPFPPFFRSLTPIHQPQQRRANQSITITWK